MMEGLTERLTRTKGLQIFEIMTDLNVSSGIKNGSVGPWVASPTLLLN